MEPPPNLHARRTQNEEDIDDPQVAQLGKECARLYAVLEECLGDNDRDWRACQKEVQALRACHEKQSAITAASSPPPATK